MGEARWRFFLAATSACSVASCAGEDVAIAPPPTDAIVVRLASAPVERYMLTAAFDGLPDAVDEFSGVARFSVSNPDCAPLDGERAFGGVRLAPRHVLPLGWGRGLDGVYRASVDLDALHDENYFGLGLCGWRFDGVEARFVVGAARFAHGLFSDEVRAQRERRGYYLVRDIEIPRRDRDIFGEDVAFYRNDLGAKFVLTLEARREARHEKGDGR